MSLVPCLTGVAFHYPCDYAAPCAVPLAPCHAACPIAAQVITRGATTRQRDAVFHKYKQQKAQKQYEARKAAELAEKKEADRLERIEAKKRMAARVGSHENKYDKE